MKNLRPSELELPSKLNDELYHTGFDEHGRPYPVVRIEDYEARDAADARLALLSANGNKLLTSKEEEHVFLAEWYQHP